MAEKIFPRFESLSHCSSSMQKISAIATLPRGRVDGSAVYGNNDGEFESHDGDADEVYGKGTLQLFALLGERF